MPYPYGPNLPQDIQDQIHRDFALVRNHRPRETERQRQLRINRWIRTVANELRAKGYRSIDLAPAERPSATASARGFAADVGQQSANLTPAGLGSIMGSWYGSSGRFRNPRNKGGGGKKITKKPNLP